MRLFKFVCRELNAKAAGDLQHDRNCRPGDRARCDRADADVAGASDRRVAGGKQ